MNYYIIKNNMIEKYRVTFNKEELEKLKVEIINNCSTIYHKEYEGVLDPFVNDELQIRNIKKRKIGIRDYENGPDMDLYLISYDEYIYPNLVHSIDRLLSGYPSAIEEIFNYEKEEIPSYEEQLERLSNELNNIDIKNINEKRKKLDEIESLLQFIELNKNQKSVNYYYSIIKKLINFELIDIISIEEIERVNSFLNRNTLENVLIKKK